MDKWTKISSFNEFKYNWEGISKDIIASIAASIAEQLRKHIDKEIMNTIYYGYTNNKGQS